MKKTKDDVRRILAPAAYALRERFQKSRHRLKYSVRFEFLKDPHTPALVSAPPAFWKWAEEECDLVSREELLDLATRSNPLDVRMVQHPAPKGYEYFERLGSHVTANMKCITGIAKNWRRVPRRMIGVSSSDFVHTLFVRPVYVGLCHASENGQPLCAEYKDGDDIAQLPGEEITCKSCLVMLDELTTLQHTKAVPSAPNIYQWRDLTRTEMAHAMKFGCVHTVTYPGCNVMRLAFASKHCVAFELEIESVREADSYQSMVFRIRNVGGEKVCQ